MGREEEREGKRGELAGKRPGKTGTGGQRAVADGEKQTVKGIRSRSRQGKAERREKGGMSPCPEAVCGETETQMEQAGAQGEGGAGRRACKKAGGGVGGGGGAENRAGCQQGGRGGPAAESQVRR